MPGLSDQKWDYGTMRQEKGKIDQEAAVFDGITSKMNNIVGVLNRAVTGEALIAIQSSHASVSAQYTKLKDILASMSASLSNAVNQMETKDADNAAAIRAKFAQFM